MTIDLEDRFVGSLLGVLVGDSLGAPLEGFEPEEIIRRYTSVTDHLPNRYGLGTYTDDSDMTILCAESLLESGRFDADAMAQHLAQRFDAERRYGRGTIEALERINDGVGWRAAAKNIYGPDGSYGNGGAIRVAPIALFYGHNVSTLTQHAVTSSALTHAHPLATTGTCLQAHAIALCTAACEQISPDGFIAQLTRSIRDLPASQEYEARLSKIPTLLSSRAKPQEIAVTLGNDVYAHASVPTAIYCFLQAPDSFEGAICYALAVGGDTDSIAAMTGAISGAYLGSIAIPQRWLDKLETGPRGQRYVATLARRLYALAASASAQSSA
jgi:poly(ADP-ribose) glycohydrolase ARH3